MNNSDIIGRFLHLKDVSIEQILQQNAVTKIAPRNQNLITLPSETSIGEALHIFDKYKILSAPVWEVEPGTLQKKFLGFIDLFDICNYLISLCATTKTAESGMKMLTWILDAPSLEIIGKSFHTSKIKDCIGKSRHVHFATVSDKAHLATLIFIMQQGIHRVAVMNEKNELSNIVTQSNVVDFVGRYIQNTKWVCPCIP